jgi:uncharacterized protein (TIGR04255 family)
MLCGTAAETLAKRLGAPIGCLWTRTASYEGVYMSYVSPPIVEAAFDLQFDEPLSESEVRRLGRSMMQSGSKLEEQFDISVTVGPAPGQAQSAAGFGGLRLTNSEATYMVVMRRLGFATIRLAPYNGWDQFEADAWGNYNAFKKALGHRKLKRIALRYINRIDIPGPDAEMKQYVKVGAKLPDAFDGGAFHVNFVSEYKGVKMILNYGEAISPLVNYSAFLVDIDVYHDQDIPQREDDLLNAFRMLRLVKNEIFEQIITDESRRLFAGEC